MPDVVSAEMHEGNDPDEVAVYVNRQNGDSWVKQVVSTRARITFGLRISDLTVISILSAQTGVGTISLLRCGGTSCPTKVPCHAADGSGQREEGTQAFYDGRGAVRCL
jgi:hypothetical protein